MKFRFLVPSIDWILVGAMLLLAGIGLAMFASTADTGSGLSPLFYRQLISLVIGLGGMALAMKIPYSSWKTAAPVLFGVGIAIQVGLLAFGKVIRGTVSRLDVLGFQIQPSEFIKVILVLMLAWLLARQKHLRFRQLWVTGILFAVPIFLVLQEPDVGMAAVMAALWVGTLIVFGLPWKYLVLLAVLGASLFGVAWKAVFLDYQKERIVTFLHPTADPLRSGYNVTQSIIALGSGQIFGRGLGHGPQSQLNFLPENHTDFILASVGEELGFVGIVLVVVLYGVLLWRVVLVFRSTSDPFGQVIACGTFFILIIGLTVNAGMNMGLLPVTGIPLPLISYGGSNLITSCFLLGLVESVKIHNTFSRYAPGELSSFT